MDTPRLSLHLKSYLHALSFFCSLSQITTFVGPMFILIFEVAAPILDLTIVWLYHPHRSLEQHILIEPSHMYKLLPRYLGFYYIYMMTRNNQCFYLETCTCFVYERAMFHRPCLGIGLLPMTTKDKDKMHPSRLHELVTRDHQKTRPPRVAMVCSDRAK